MSMSKSARNTKSVPTRGGTTRDTHGAANRPAGGAIAGDVAKAFGIGIAAGIAVGAIAFIGGFAFGGAGVTSGVEAMKDALLLVAAIMLFVLAGMLLIKGKKKETPFADENGWRRHFAAIGPKSVIGAIALGVVAVAIAADYLQFLLH